MYDVVRFPLDTPDTAQRHLPYDSIQRIDDSQQNLYLKQKNRIKNKSSTLKPSVGVIKSPRRDQVNFVNRLELKIWVGTSKLKVCTQPLINC